MQLLLLQVCTVLEALGSLGHCGDGLSSPLAALLMGLTGVGPRGISEAQIWRLSLTIGSWVLLTTLFLISSNRTSQRTQIPDRKLVEEEGQRTEGLEPETTLGSRLPSGFLETTSSRQALRLSKAWFIF